MTTRFILRSAKAFGLISLCLWLSACVTPPSPIAPDVAARIRRVAVISQTGDQFTRQYTGVTVFGNEKEEMPIATWKLDEQYESQIASELVHFPGLNVVKVPYSQEAFAHVNDLNGPWNAPAFWGPNWDAVASATKSHCTEHGLDAIVMVTKAKSGDFLTGTNQVFGGAGIYVRGPGARVSVLHLISIVALVDCASAKPLAIRTLAGNQDGNPGAILRSVPLREVPQEISRAPLPQWTDEQRQQIQAELVTLPTRTWGPTLKSIFPSAPSTR